MKLKVTIIALIISFNFCFVAFADTNADLENENFKRYKQINSDGFGNRYNRVCRGTEIFNDTLVIGTGNFNRDRFFRNDNPLSFINFLKALINGADLKKMESDGCEIWTYNGTKMKQIVGSDSYIKAGFGNKNNSEIGFLIEFKNYLYAGVRNHLEGCEIWRTKNLEDWEKIVDSGFGAKSNVWAMTATVFNNTLFVGTMNNKIGSEIYKTKDGFNWTQVVGRNSTIKNGFGSKSNYYIWSMCEYNNKLYFGTCSGFGGELWRTSDGENFEPIIAGRSKIQAKKIGAIKPRGIGKFFVNVVGFRNMLEYNGELYLFTSAWGDFKTTLQTHFLEIGLKFRIPTIRLPTYTNPFGGQIWKYNETANKLTRMVGGWGKDTNSSGFGDRKNVYFWSVEKINETIYVGTANLKPLNLRIQRLGLFDWGFSVDMIEGKGQLWKSTDGKNWEPVMDNGLRDDYNVGIREIKFYKDHLILGLANFNTGTEIWEYKF